MTKEISMERRLAFVRQDIARLLEELPKEVLGTQIDEYSTNLGEILNGIAIACDESNQEPVYWIRNWFEVFRLDDEGIKETIAEFDTKKQALDFMWERSLNYPETELGYEEWESNGEAKGIKY
jgi:hypothetical protein